MDDFKKGQRVVVLKGAPVRSLTGRDRIQGRNMTVTVDHVRRWGVMDHTPEVVWAGSGGYWTSTTFDWVRHSGEPTP